MKLNKNEVAVLRMILYYLTEHTWGDDRPDHGLERLKDMSMYKDDIGQLYRRFNNSYKRMK